MDRLPSTSVTVNLTCQPMNVNLQRGGDDHEGEEDMVGDEKGYYDRDSLE